MKFKNLIIKNFEKISIVEINKPEVLNALDLDLYKEIRDCFLFLDKDKNTEIIILTGVGKSFVAGADIKYMRQLKVEEGKEFGNLGTSSFKAVAENKKVTIAAINGYALGGGCELALACDLRVASDTAKFGQPEVSLGIIPGSGGTQRLSRIIGIAKAKELIFTGEIINANEALRIGLVNKVISQEELINEAIQLAKKIQKNSLKAVEYAKEAIVKGNQVDIDTSMFIENNLFGLCLTFDDYKKRMKRF